MFLGCLSCHALGQIMSRKLIVSATQASSTGEARRAWHLVGTPCPVWNSRRARNIWVLACPMAEDLDKQSMLGRRQWLKLP